MADRTWQIEHRGEFRLALRRATSLPRGNKRDYVSYKTLVRWRFACALRGSARGFWFIDPLGLRPRGLCTVATRACHVNHAPPSYNYNIDITVCDSARRKIQAIQTTMFGSLPLANYWHPYLSLFVLKRTFSTLWVYLNTQVTTSTNLQAPHCMHVSHHGDLARCPDPVNIVG